MLEDQKDFTAENTEEQPEVVEEFANEATEEEAEAVELEEFSEETEEQEAQQEENFELNSNIVDGLYAAIGSEKITDRWGDEYNRYAYIDFDAEQGFVYVYDRTDYNLYGFGYSLNNDETVVDFNSKRRMKWAIVEFNGAEQPSILSPIFSEYEKKIDEGKEFEKKFQEAEAEIESMKSELNELREFKAQTENAIVEQKRSELFSMFEDLNGIEAFELLKENFDISIEDLEEKCFAIRGRNASQAKFSFENKSTKIKVAQSENNDAPYGGIVEKYLGSAN